MQTGKLLVRYHEDFGRAGSREDLFVTSALELRALKAVGRVYRGELLGKHSNIVSDLDDNTLIVLTDDAAFIDKASEYKLVSGNPFLDTLCYESVETANATRDKLEANLTPEDFTAIITLWGIEN